MTAGNLRALAPGPTRRCDMRCGQRAFGVRSLGSWGEGPRIVQHESTATGLDAGGPGCILRDGGLRLRTPVDGLPLDGMQEVWGSNPHSSTREVFTFRCGLFSRLGLTFWLAPGWLRAGAGVVWPVFLCPCS